MKPVGYQILAEDTTQEITKGGIIITGASSMKQHEAKVLDVGPKVEHVKVGDTIRFNPIHAHSYKHEGKKCVFVSEKKDTSLLIVGR